MLLENVVSQVAFMEYGHHTADFPDQAVDFLLNRFFIKSLEQVFRQEQVDIFDFVLFVVLWLDAWITLSLQKCDQYTAVTHLQKLPNQLRLYSHVLPTCLVYCSLQFVRFALVLFRLGFVIHCLLLSGLSCI